MLVGGICAADARAGQVPLPTTLDQLLIPGNFAVTGREPDTFSNFSFSVSPLGSPPTPANINVNPFTLGNEDGIQFQAPFRAGPNAVVDYAISYIVSAPAGFKLNDAFASAVFNLPVGTTGTVSIGETFVNADTLTPIGQIQLDPTHLSGTINFGDVQRILVTKDILIDGGSLGAGVSVINQGYSSHGTTPEPASWALLGIGMTGFLAFRRFFKKTPVA